MTDSQKRQLTGAEKQALINQAQVPKYQRTPPPQARSTRPVHLALTILILGYAVFYSMRSGQKAAKVVYGHGGKDLPEYYALCSKDGQGVYTVPEAGGVGAAECVVVGGKEVLGSGSLSMSTPTDACMQDDNNADAEIVFEESGATKRPSAVLMARPKRCAKPEG